MIPNWHPNNTLMVRTNNYNSQGRKRTKGIQQKRKVTQKAKREHKMKAKGRKTTQGAYKHRTGVKRFKL